MSHFTPITALLGGLTIGVAALILLLGAGRIAGYSGIITNAFIKPKQGWRWTFLLSTILGATGSVVLFDLPVSHLQFTPHLIIAGLLVGFGSRLGNGCTSGHGICGIGRLSPRSIVATLIFMATGIITVYLFH